MKEEMHVFLDSRDDYYEFKNLITTNYGDLYSEMCDDRVPIIYTTLPCYLSFVDAKRLFVYAYGKKHEITLGECEGTNREIRTGHNIEKMLFAGEFDWF